MKILIALNILICSLLFSPAFATQPDPSHIPWTKEDSSAIDALDLYPDSVRLDIFQACEYPAVIVNVSSIQKNSSAAFASLVSSYTKEQQEDIWNMSRYPGLISQLAKANMSDAQITTVLANYPAEIHDVALKYAKNPVLKSIDSLQTSTDSQFDQTISYYSVDVQGTFRRLLQYPEVLSLLNDHLSLAVRVGDHYKRDPQWVIHKADSNNLAQTKINAQETQAWKDSIQHDTAAQSDLKNAANEYADSNGYATSQVDKPLDENAVSNYSCYPYSYWFGYPTWYPYQYWYPYPYWYDWGFYYGPYGNMVVFGMPSFYFTNWYFYYPYHWRRYPHLGGSYVNHFYGPRRFYSRSAMVVHSWVHNNRNYLPKDFISSRPTRVEAIRELGQLHQSVERPGMPVTNSMKDDYIQKNTTKFPMLNSRPQQAVAPIRDERVPNVIQQPTRQPMVAPNPRTNTYTAPARTAPPAYNYNRVNQAQEYHQSRWENTQPTYHAAPAPAPSRSYSAPAPARSGGGGGRR